MSQSSGASPEPPAAPVVWSWMTRLRAAGAQAIPSGKFGRNIFVVAGGTVFAQVVAVGASPVLTRLYTPADYATLAVFSGVVSTLMAMASLRFDWTLPVPKSEEDAAHLLAVSLLLVAGWTAVLAVIAAVGMTWTSTVPTSLASIAPYLWLIPLSVAGGGAYQALSAWVIRHGDLRPLARTKITQSLSGTAVSLAGGLASIGPIGLLLGVLTSRGSGVRVLGKHSWRTHRDLFRRVQVAGLMPMVRRYGRMAAAACGSSLLNTAGLDWPAIVLASLYAPTEVGWFVLSIRVIGMPLALVSSPVAQAFWSEAAGLVHDNPQRLRQQFLRATRALLGVSALLIVMGVSSPYFLGYVFGNERWHGVGTYTLYLTPLFATRIVISPISHLMIHARQHWQLWFEAIRLVISLGGLVAARRLGWSAGAAILEYSLVNAAFYAFLYWMNLRAINDRIVAFEKRALS